MKKTTVNSGAAVRFFLSVAVFAAGFAGVLTATAVATEAVPQVTVDVPQTSVEIGDPLAYTIRITVPDGIELNESLPQGELGPWTVRRLDRSQKQTETGRLLQYNYELAGFQVGEQEIPSFDVQYRSEGAASTAWKSVSVPARQVTVTGVIPQGQAPAIQAIKPRMSRWQRRFVRWAAALLALALAVGAAWYWRRHKKQTVVAPRRIPAHERALAAMEELRQLSLPAQGRMPEYFVRLADIVRHYLEDRFGLHAPTMSTEEFLAQARRSASLESAHKQALKRFLELADLVKFARYGSSLSEADDAYSGARDLIEQTREPEPVTAEVAG